MRTVFVVMGEHGEYSDRNVWVSGVFETREAAEAAIIAGMAARRTYDQWCEAKRRAWPKMPFDYFRFPLSNEQKVERDAIEQKAEAAAGPKPPYEPAEYCELFEVPLGVWQSERLERARLTGDLGK